MVDIDALVEMYEARLHDEWEHGKFMQLKYATEVPFFYDIPALEFQRSLYVDNICRELDNMVMREEITQDEYWEIEDRL
jgi:hypothetical protein